MADSLTDHFRSLSARVVKLSQANPEVGRQHFLVRARLGAASFLTKVRSLSFIKRPIADLFSRNAKSVRKFGWKVRSIAASLPGATRLWEAVRPWAYRLRIRRLPIDRLLMGGLNGTSVSEFSAVIGDPLYASTRIGESSLVELLEAFDRDGDDSLTTERILESGYFERAKAFIAIDGHYIGARTDEEIIDVTREFVYWYRGQSKKIRSERGTKNSKPFVRKIRNSDCYSIVDGHHRLALAAKRGETEVEVVVGLGSTSTPIQDRLLRMSWLGGLKELYQPIDLPELETWVKARKCVDRMEMAKEFLLQGGLIPIAPNTTLKYLDVGSFYGWFVSEFTKLGFDAHGVEADPLAHEVGQIVYGLSPSQVHIGEASEFLRMNENSFDVVSCFSVLHHFALGRGPCSAAELMHLLSASTRKVLFFDTGQSHESWMKNILPGWTPEYISQWIIEHSDFDEVIALGIDQDARPPYSDNYGRTFFACVKKQFL